MLKNHDIIPFLETVIARATKRYTCPLGRYVKRSPTHRLITDLLLLRHFRGQECRCVSKLIDYVPASAESVRRAIKEGITDKIITVIPDPDGDSRKKCLVASQLLVDAFLKRYVESGSNDQQNKEKQNDESVERTHTSKREAFPSGHNAG